MTSSRNNENNDLNSKNSPSPPKSRQKTRNKKPSVPPPTPTAPRKPQSPPAAQKKIRQKSAPPQKSPPTKRSPTKNSPRKKNNIGIITIRGLGSRPVGSHISAVAILIPRITNNYKHETKKGSDTTQPVNPNRKQTRPVGRNMPFTRRLRTFCSRLLGNLPKTAGMARRRCYKHLQYLVQPTNSAITELNRAAKTPVPQKGKVDNNL